VNRIRLEGDRVTIRPLRMDEFEASWTSRLQLDPTVQPVMPERDALRARFERSGIMKDGAVDLAIEVDGRKIGEIQTYVPPGRALPAGAFEVGIGIADPPDRGKGYGTDALNALVDFGFGELRLERIELEVFDYNLRAIRSYEKAGFQTDAVLRRSRFHRGAHHDVHLMSILRDDWAAMPRKRSWDLAEA